MVRSGATEAFWADLLKAWCLCKNGDSIVAREKALNPETGDIECQCEGNETEISSTQQNICRYFKDKSVDEAESWDLDELHRGDHGGKPVLARLWWRPLYGLVSSHVVANNFSPKFGAFSNDDVQAAHRDTKYKSHGNSFYFSGTDKCRNK